MVASAAVVFAVLVGLGTWQVHRLAWKEALLATIAERVDAQPVDLDTALASGRSIAEMEYTPVIVSGTFDHAAERHFFATWQGASGYYVYTPLKRDDGSWLFVNRGFVPFERKEASTRMEGQVDGRVTVIGLLRSALAEKPSSILPDNEPGKNIFYWKDIRAMAASSGLPADADIIGLFVDAGPAPNPGGLPVGGVTLIDLPNNHLQYAFTWYGLAAALAAVTVLSVVRGRRGGGAAGDDG
jgi:surfeit locus 1 family protein